MSQDIHAIVETRRVALLARAPFFGILLSYLRLEGHPAAWFEERGLLPTACTDGERIYYCEEWVERLMRTEPDAILTVLAHEVLHPALSHLWRRGARDRLLWNVACDAIVNDILQRSGFSLPKDAVTRAPEWASLPEEVIYERLKSKAVKIAAFALQGDMLEPAAPDRRGGQGSKGDTKAKAHGAASGGHGQQDRDGSASGDSDGGQEGNTADRQGGGAADAARRMQDVWRRRLVRAYQAAKSQGRAPGGVEELIDELLYPSQDWRAILARFVQPTQFDYDWLRPDRRLLGAHGVYVPTLSGERVEDIVCYVDTSGSMGAEEIRACLSEVRGILQAFPYVRAHLVTGDAKVWEWQELTEQDPVPRKVKGRGGTDFRPVFDEIDRRGITPSALIMFTDGMGDYPDRPPSYPVLWVLTPNHEKPPFGIVTVLRE